MLSKVTGEGKLLGGGDLKNLDGDHQSQTPPSARGGNSSSEKKLGDPGEKGGKGFHHKKEHSFKPGSSDSGEGGEREAFPGRKNFEGKTI